MTEPPTDPYRSWTSWTIFPLFIGLAALIISGRADYPNLHIILDTSICLLSGVLGALLREMGRRLSLPLYGWLALGFAATSLSELIHVLVVVEWSGALAGIAEGRT